MKFGEDYINDLSSNIGFGSSGEKPKLVYPYFHLPVTGETIFFEWSFSFEPCPSMSRWYYLIHNKTYTLSFRDAFILLHPGRAAALPYIYKHYPHCKIELLPGYSTTAPKDHTFLGKRTQQPPASYCTNLSPHHVRLYFPITQC